MAVTREVRNRNFMNMLTAIADDWGDPFELGFAATNLIIRNKGSETIEFSFDADFVEGELDGVVQPDPPEEITMSQMPDGIRKVYVRSSSGGQTVRVWAWQRGTIG